jgi:hypothetical protein
MVNISHWANQVLTSVIHVTNQQYKFVVLRKNGTYAGGNHHLIWLKFHVEI